MENTFGLLKPDCIEKRLTGKSLDFILKHDFTIKKIKKLKLNLREAEQFYIEHKGKEFYEGLTRFMSSGPIIPMVLSKKNAIEDFRNIIGDTDPEVAEEGTLRHKYAESVRHNIVHGADSNKSAQREMKFFFPEIEIIN